MRVHLVSPPRGRQPRPADALSQQVGAVLATHQVRGKSSPGPRTDARQAQRQRRVMRLYRDLAAAGYALTDVRKLERSHALALLAFWQGRKRAVSTIRSDWAFLRQWTRLLGLPGLVAPLSEYVPPLYQRRTSEPSPRHNDAGLLARLQKSRDQTHYHIERVCKCARLTVEEALTFEPGTLEASETSRAAQRMRAATQDGGLDAQAALHELVRFLHASGRKTLLWPGLTVEQALRRHGNHLNYLRKVARKRSATVSSQ